MDTAVRRRAGDVRPGRALRTLCRALLVAVPSLSLSCGLFWQLTAERLVSSFPLQKSIAGAAMDGARLYLACGYSWEPGLTLMTLDISDPVALASIGEPYPLGISSVRSVSVSGDRVFLSGSSLAVVDVSNPSAPTTVKTFSLGASSGGSICSVAGAYLIAVVSSPPDVLVKVYDLSDLVNAAPPFPAPVGSLTLPGDSLDWGAQALIVDRRLYIFSSSAFTIVDLSVIATPALLSATPFYDGVSGEKGLALKGGCAFLGCEYGEGFSRSGETLILDVSNGAAPVYLATLEDLGAAMAVSGDYLLSASPVTGGSLVVHDISNAFVPRYAATLNVRKSGESILPLGDYVLLLDSAISTVLIAPYR